MRKLIERIQNLSGVLLRVHREGAELSAQAAAIGNALGASVEIVSRTGAKLASLAWAVPDCELLTEPGPGEVVALRAGGELPAGVHACLPGTGRDCRRAHQLSLGIAGADGDEAPGRVGTLRLARCGKGFSDEDRVIAEMFLAVLSIEMMHRQSDRQQEIARHEASVRTAMASLSLAERQVVQRILQEINNNAGYIVSLRIARELRLAHSLVVNTLRKLEGAAIIRTGSRGMKGTYVQVINDSLLTVAQKGPLLWEGV